ncbi:hypothetical protein WJX74_004522 [Apatococcus lobatus]|uniref:Major facilitator superfamily (MFS) profile domain-containing protein n=1 Tax=Apatococcus lobatus TaxID=904363 RepID=A0AAW1SC31_9CHLO
MADFHDDSAHAPKGGVMGGTQGEHTNEKQIAHAFEDDVPKFGYPVDSEHKAKTLRLFSFARPHYLSFHLNWIAFFTVFMSAYAAAPIVEYIRDDLNLTQFQANVAGVVTTSGTVFARVAMGQVCDSFGPRYAYGFLLMLTSSFVFGISVVHNAAGYIASRLLIGIALAGFVTCQFWASMLFSPNVVGIANAVAGGWGNAGGGVIQIVMPYIVYGLSKHHFTFVAWRLAFYVPASMHIIIALLIILLGQDLPDGNYHLLKRTGKMQKAKPLRQFWNGITNYRMWGLAACYAYSFGVELTLDNALAPYLTNQFGFSITKAGNLAAIFGIMNFGARPAGGILSDVLGKRFGIRGRIWALFLVFSLGGFFTAMTGVLAFRPFKVTLAMYILAGIFLEATCGAVYGVVPFVSRRSLGMVCGLVSAGGAIGGVMNQAIFFLKSPSMSGYITPYNGIKWMGTVACGVAILGISTIYFPMWGGMFLPAKAGYTEEDYYFSEYTEAEREEGLHLASSKFAHESRSMRGMKRLMQWQQQHGDVLATGGRDSPLDSNPKDLKSSGPAVV